MSEKIQVWLEKDSPNTNAILGAVLSGGNPIKLAKILIDKENQDE